MPKEYKYFCLTVCLTLSHSVTFCLTPVFQMMSHCSGGMAVGTKYENLNIICAIYCWLFQNLIGSVRIVALKYMSFDSSRTERNFSKCRAVRRLKSRSAKDTDRRLHFRSLLRLHHASVKLLTRPPNMSNATNAAWSVMMHRRQSHYNKACSVLGWFSLRITLLFAKSFLIGLE